MIIEFPFSDNSKIISRNTLISSKCKPVVGSSKIYMVFPVSFFESSVANLILCDSPPDNVVDCCPSVI